jgi:mRNA interferase MazF
MKHTETYDQFDVIKVPFPFTDKNSSRQRPAVVISTKDYQINNNHCILAMITSARHSSWIDDIEITDLDLAGLDSPSIIRFKLVSLEENLVLAKLGKLANRDIEKLSKTLKKYLGT